MSKKFPISLYLKIKKKHFKAQQNFRVKNLYDILSLRPSKSLGSCDSEVTKVSENDVEWIKISKTLCYQES